MQTMEHMIENATSRGNDLKAWDWRDHVNVVDFNGDSKSIFKPAINATHFPVEKPTCEDSYHCGYSFASLTAARLWLSKHGKNVNVNSFWHGYLARNH